jgi:hypothetical protein
MNDNEQPQEQAIIIQFHTPGSLEFDIKVLGCGPVHLLAAATALREITDPGMWGNLPADNSSGITVDFSQAKMASKSPVILNGRISFVQLWGVAGYLRAMGERQLNDGWTAEIARKQRDRQEQRQVESLIKQQPGFIRGTGGGH